MSAISGLMVGTQYFQASDLPLSVHFQSSMGLLRHWLTLPSYQNGLRTIIIMITVGIAFALIQIAIYVIHNRRVAEGKHTRTEKDGSKPRRYTP